MAAVPIQNPFFADLGVDYLYHLGLDSSQDLVGMFSDVKFVCMGGSAPRAEAFAYLVARELKLDVPIEPIGKTERFSLYKVGPVISVNHGMGMPSHSILLHEIAKLLHHAKARDVVFIRVGTSGGLGVAPGTVVVASEAYNNELKPAHRAVVLGKVYEYPTKLDAELCQVALDAAQGTDGEAPVPCVIGKTMGTDDFYEGQGRMDGALCEFTAQEQRAWIEEIARAGITNIEMEAPQYAAFCSRLGIRAVLMCGVIVNRLLGDQVTSTPEELKLVADNVFQVAMRFIKRRLSA